MLRARCLGLALMFLAGCKEHAPAAADAAVKEQAATSTSAGKKPFDALAANLFGQMSEEAKHRVEGAPRIEALVAAVNAAGLTAEAPHQTLAATVRAKYCGASKVAANVGFTVCEFADEAARELGKKTAQAYAVQHRTITENKGSLLIMLRLAETDSARKEAEIIEREFKKL